MTDNTKNYLQSLDDCKRVAKREFNVVKTYFEQCDKIIDALKINLNTVVSQGTQVLSKDKLVEDGLSNMLINLEKDYFNLLEKRNSNIAKQKHSLDFFNIMLFGRTMVGKSTIREAITGGNGNTIGKGAQRTTRDVREYEWNNLRIIDTPGFGAYGGGDDTQIAHEILERSDVVLFMLNSDSIQESTFTELEYVQKLNKTLIFVLNMKKDLKDEGNRRRALKSPEKYIYKADDIYAHRERLKDLVAKTGKAPKSLRIIPIHAQAAFLATIASEEDSKNLHELSCIDDLLNVLQDEVKSNGPIRRVQTFLDSSSFHVVQQQLILLEQKGKISSLLEQYESSFQRIIHWKKKTLRDTPRLLSKTVDEALKPLLDSIPDFVDDNIENERVVHAWEEHLKNYKFKENIKKEVNSFTEQIVEELTEFNHEMNEGLEINQLFDLKHSGDRFSEFDYKRINGWGSALAGVVGAVAVYMSWNPIGWAAAGIGAIFAIFSFFSDSKAKKINAEKAKQRTTLTSQINKNKDKINQSLNEWFDLQVHRAIILPVELSLSKLCTSLSAFNFQLNLAIEELQSLESDINYRLLNQVAKILTKQHFILPKMSKIVRVPGYACYFHTLEYFRDTKLLINIGEAIGEKVLVIYNNGLESQLNHIYKGLLERVEIIHSNKAIIYVKQSNIGKVLGSNHRKIKMVAGICSSEIEYKIV